ncbi:unnamed protein product [Urochloa humidicola]
MDLVCDALLAEEILPRLPLKCVLRFGATSRRHNGIVLSAEFHARYWQRARSSVFVQPFGLGAAEPVRAPRFLTGTSASGSSVPGADLAFMPGATAREEAYLRSLGAPPGPGLAVVHSAAGLLLCSRGRVRPVHYYVCNPVTWQWVALPELPCPSSQPQYGVLTTVEAAATRFRVVLFNEPSHWQKREYKGDGRLLDLRVFSSDTGRWEAKQLEFPLYNVGGLFSPPTLVQTGQAFWIPALGGNHAVAYDAARPDDTVYLLDLPPHGHPLHRAMGRRRDGTLLYAHLGFGSASSELQVWDMRLRGGKGAWELAHQTSVAELLRRNPQVEALLHNSRTPLLGSEVSHGERLLFSPLGFHPTRHDVVFLAVPGAVAAYSMELGTVSLECTLDDGFLLGPYDLFQYEHPPWPVQIPAIKSSDIPESLRAPLPSPELLLLDEMVACSCVLLPRSQ